MRTITLFMNVSLDGYIAGPGDDLSAFHSDFEAFSSADGPRADTVLLGHKTYDMMKTFWPTPQAAQFAPEVARYMNETQKVIASNTPFDPGWQNVTVFSDDVIDQVRQLKAQPGGTIMIFGSNTLCVSLLPERLIDQFQIQVIPVVLGAGTKLFDGLAEQVAFTLTHAQPFKSGAALLTYTPA